MHTLKERMEFEERAFWKSIECTGKMDEKQRGRMMDWIICYREDRD